MLAGDRLDRRTRERRLAGQHLVQYAAQRVQVAAPIEIVVARRLLGTHVGRCPNGDAGSRERFGPGGADGSRDAEIRDDRVAALEQNVLRLDVPMDDTACVRVAEGVGHFSRDAERVIDGELALAR